MSLEDELIVAEIEDDRAEATRLRYLIERRRVDALLAPVEEGIEL